MIRSLSLSLLACMDWKPFGFPTETNMVLQGKFLFHPHFLVPRAIMLPRVSRWKGPVVRGIGAEYQSLLGR